MAVLLLQGPLGPFFEKFAAYLQDAGEIVHKVNFNGGDEFYNTGRYSQQHRFADTLEQWPAFLSDLIDSQHIEQVFVYGDCRQYHASAKAVCQTKNVRYFAFEEGYLRPNFITLEEGGVNGHSPVNPAAVRGYRPIHKLPDEVELGSNFVNRFKFASVYYNSAVTKRWVYRHYQHHRSFSPVYEAFCWLRSGFRKTKYKWTQRDLLDPILDQPFFLVPLQVHNDAQILHHSPYESIEHFIEEVLTSFKNSGSEAKLVLKHHPMDRGHTHYGSFIHRIARRLNLLERVVYLHDNHLPTLLKHCCGVVTINSTTALQAFYHGAPVKVLGDAFFDMDGLTDQNPLSEFWHCPQFIDMNLADRFRAYLIAHGQINGSYYCHWDLTLNNLMTYLYESGVFVRLEDPLTASTHAPANSSLTAAQAAQHSRVA